MRRLACVLLGLVIPAIAESAENWSPWDALFNDCWVGPSTVSMHASNTDVNYTVRFADARLDNVAGGMNAFRFSLTADGQSIGHMFSTFWADDFFVRNFSGTDGGQGYDYSDFLVLIVIEANALPSEFSLLLSVPGSNEETVVLGEPNFVYYNHPDYQTGRPSGYYSATDPNREALAYAFDTSDFHYDFDANNPRHACERGMVSIAAFSGVALTKGGGAVQVDYEFGHIGGTAIFSVYGYRDGLIKHTNRAVLDNNDGLSFVSTFEVVPIAGDFDGDSDVDMTDFAAFLQYWLEQMCTDAELCGLADFDNSGTVDFYDFAILASRWH